MQTQKRIAAGAVEVGDVLVSINPKNRRPREINSRVINHREPPVGMPVAGPRGGRYALTAAGAATMIVVKTASGPAPVLDRTTSVTVLHETPDAD